MLIAMCRYVRQLLVLLVLMLLQIAPGSAWLSSAVAGNLLWKVAGEKGGVYLLGSIHFGKQNMYPLDDAINRAYQAADALVVEINILELDLVETARVMSGKGFYTDGTNLQSHLSPATWNALGAAAARHDLPLAFFQPQKPWLVTMTLSVLELKRAGYDENLGIDKHFLDLAKSRKPILELETFAQQIDFLNGFSPEEQEALLRQTLLDLKQSADYFDAIVRAWQNGDDNHIDAIINKQLLQDSLSDASSKKIYRVLLTERNQAMSEKIEQLMTDGRTYFVVVGAGHLVGEDGIVNLFTQKPGYTVEKL